MNPTDNIDINILIETFNTKISQLTSELVVKETIIKQLLARMNELEKEENND